MEYDISIDNTLCKACGRCRAECNKHLPVHRGMERLNGDVECIGCLHCYAVCLQNAISVRELDLTGPSRQDQGLMDLVTGRRSCRRYTDDDIEPDLLNEILEYANQIHSGGNCHAHQLTILERSATRKRLEQCLRRAGSVFSDAETRAFLKDEFYPRQIMFLLEQFDNGMDPIFYRAPIVIFVHTGRLIPTPMEDCVSAAYNMSLAAHVFGLGSSMVSLAQKAINDSRSIKRLIGISPNAHIHVVLVLGHQQSEFLRGVRHRPVRTSVLDREQLIATEV